MHRSFCSQLVTCILIAVVIQVTTNELGEECTDKNNLKGICKLLVDCPHVLQLKSNNRRYSRCAFNGVREVVCCAQRNVNSGPVQTKIPDRRYVRECELYKSIAFDIENLFTPLTANAHTIKKTVSKCSQNTFPLVVSGENANPKEFPHMALVGCKDAKGKIQWICGGTLISPYFVLTAAHCFEDVQCDEINTVRLGDLDIDSTTDDAQPKDFDIEKTIIHPEYNETIKYNDIALLKLKTRVQINPYIRPACLPFQQYSNVSQLIITGWGAKEFAQSFTSHLQKATVEPFEQAECNEVYIEEGSDKWPVGVRERTQICAGSKQGRNDTCQGDSGGPLQIIHPLYPCMYTVVGITSTGQACGTEGVPAIYTRVFFYIDWIESVVWE